MKISYYPNNLPGNADLVYPKVLDAIKQTDTLVEANSEADAALIWSVLWFGRMSGNKKIMPNGTMGNATLLWDCSMD